MKCLLKPTVCLVLIGSVDPELSLCSPGVFMIHIFMANADVTSSSTVLPNSKIDVRIFMNVCM